MADDLGWNDVGFHNPKVITPNINALKAKGIELTQSYVTPVCSATRSAFMTGYYPSNNGLQLLVILQESQTCLPVEFRTIYNYMKDEGYVTKQIGKWHLGYCTPECLPEARGVDVFRGVRTGAVNYFNWTEAGVLQRQVNGAPSTENIGTHLTIQDTRDIREVILDHANNPNPLFMWITTTAPHDPLQTTPEQYNVHSFLNPNDELTNSRRLYLGLVSALDDLVGGTMQALQDAGMASNTVVVFSSDNGGASQSITFGNNEDFANNYPLRGGKTTFTEGGVRTPTIYYDPRLSPSTRGTTRNFLIHTVDWLPTFVQMARPGKKRSNFKIPDIDGVSQLANLGSNYNCPEKRRYNIRDQFLVALSDATGDIVNPSDCATEDAAYRWRDYKLIYGDQYYLRDPATVATEWTIPEESPELPAITGDDCHRIVNGQRVVRCLFNVIEDPRETKNLFDAQPRIVERLLRKIQEFKEISVRPVFRQSLGANDFTTQPFGDFIVPRHDYCVPSVNFPLVQNAPVCFI
ncbi:arylsulfatase B-like [Watersipora subatra]|uniref:arylsulfatase B-like n=1 Tax=Watersipora subatra TaxID=2589382 RepID=UPI00355B3FDB